MGYKAFLLCVILYVAHSYCVQAQTLEEQRKQTEENFKRVLDGGMPLVIPLWQESAPAVFLMPVSYTPQDSIIDRLCLVDATNGFVDYTQDIYVVDSIFYYPDAYDYIAFCCGLNNKVITTYHISSYLYHVIKKINKGVHEWPSFPSHIKIPIRKKQINK